MPLEDMIGETENSPLITNLCDSKGLVGFCKRVQI